MTKLYKPNASGKIRGRMRIMAKLPTLMIINMPRAFAASTSQQLAFRTTVLIMWISFGTILTTRLPMGRAFMWGILGVGVAGIAGTTGVGAGVVAGTVGIVGAAGASMTLGADLAGTAGVAVGTAGTIPTGAGALAAAGAAGTILGSMAIIMP